MDKIKLRKAFALWKPAKHGDAISFEDFVENLNKIELAINANILWGELFLIDNDKAETVATFADLPTDPEVGQAVWVSEDKESNKPNTVFNTLYKWLPLEDLNGDGIADSYKWAVIVPGSKSPAEAVIVGKLLSDAGFIDDIANNLKNDPNFKASVKGDQGKQGIQGLKGEGLNWLSDNYTDLTDFENNAKDYEIVKYNLNKNGSNNAEGIVMLVKIGSEVKEFRTWEETKQYVDSQILLVQADINVVEKDLDKLTEKVDANTTDVNDLASQVQSIENTWTGSQGFGGSNPAQPEIDLKTLTGDKGAFDFTAGKKMLVKITLNNTLYSAEQLMRVGDHSSFHISGRKLDGGETTDVTFTLSLNVNGILKMNDFHSTGTANQNAFFLRLELIEQNPKVVAVIDAYTKSETNTKLDAKADKTAVYTKTESDNKYETKTDITTKLNGKADKASVYTKAESDGKYATKTELASAGDTSWKTSKQDTLTKTLTLHWDDGTTEDIKVG